MKTYHLILGLSLVRVERNYSDSEGNYITDVSKDCGSTQIWKENTQFYDDRTNYYLGKYEVWNTSSELEFCQVSKKFVSTSLVRVSIVIDSECTSEYFMCEGTLADSQFDWAVEWGYYTELSKEL